MFNDVRVDLIIKEDYIKEKDYLKNNKLARYSTKLNYNI